MSINLIWSVLMQGKRYDSQEISRKVTRDVFNEDTKYLTTLNTLVPYKDRLLRSFQVEQLVKLLLSGDLRDRALSFDPINSYEKSTLIFPEPGSSNTAMPNNARVTSVLGQNAFTEYGNGQVLFKCSVVPSTSTFITSHGSSTYTTTGSLTSLINITGGFNIRMKGDLGSAPFSFNLVYTAEPTIDWIALWGGIRNMQHTWKSSALRDIYTGDIHWQNKLSAVIMNAVENSLR